MASPASSSFDSLFEEDWRNLGGQELGLDSISTFIASLTDEGSVSGEIGNGIDPQLLHSTPSPSPNHTPFRHDTMTPSYNGLPQGEMLDFFAPSTANSSAHMGGPSPYFHQSIRQHGPFMLQQPFHVPSPLGKQLHRRSVSEPPGQHHISGRFPPHHPPSNPIFTRSGTPLGTPRASGTTASRPPAKLRQPIYRQQYSVAKRQAPRQERHPIRRTQTQPVHSVQSPTSAPSMDVFHSPPPQSILTPSMVSSRVCTPALPPPLIASPSNADPGMNLQRSGQEAVAIPVTVEELKRMIMEAVREAVGAALNGGVTGSSGSPHTVVGVDTDLGDLDARIDGLEGIDVATDEQMDFAVGEGVRKSIEGEDSLFGPD